MNEETPTVGELQEKIGTLEARIGELESWRTAMVDVVFTQIGAIEEDVEAMKTGGVTPAPPVPLITREPDADGHVIIEGQEARAQAKKGALGISMYPDGMTSAVTCDELKCAAPGHVELMSKPDAKKLNTDRVSRELSAMPRQEVRFALECLSTDIGDGHRVSTEGSMYVLPNGRKISFIRAVSWAFSHKPTPPVVKRTCGRADCVAYGHLSN